MSTHWIANGSHGILMCTHWVLAGQSRRAAGNLQRQANGARGLLGSTDSQRIFHPIRESSRLKCPKSAPLCPSVCMGRALSTVHERARVLVFESRGARASLVHTYASAAWQQWKRSSLDAYEGACAGWGVWVCGCMRLRTRACASECVPAHTHVLLAGLAAVRVGVFVGSKAQPHTDNTTALKDGRNDIHSQRCVGATHSQQHCMGPTGMPNTHTPHTHTHVHAEQTHSHTLTHAHTHACTGDCAQRLHVDVGRPSCMRVVVDDTLIDT
jgi:hypothetical protein